MNGWRTVVLGDICTSVDYGYTASADVTPVGPKFLRITDIQDDCVNWDTVPFCVCDVSEGEKWKLSPGDILFARTGATTGKSFLVRSCPANSIFASYLIRVRPGKKALPEFLAHYFKTPQYWAQISLNIRGAAQGGVNATTLKQLSLPLPPLPEQQRIAAILDQAEALRAKRRQALAALETAEGSIFHELFGDPIKNTKGWSDGETLGDIAEVVTGITKGRKAPVGKLREVPYLAVVHVQDKSLNLNVLKTIEASEEELERYRLLKDDLLLTEGGDPDKLGRGTLWNNELPECIHQNHIFRARVQSNRFLPLFLSRLLSSERGKRYFFKSAKQTTGIATINMTQLRGFPLLAPPLPLQRQFAAQVAAVERLKAAQRASLAKLDELFASLQHRAFRGELTGPGQISLPLG